MQKACIVYCVSFHITIKARERRYKQLNTSILCKKNCDISYAHFVYDYIQTLHKKHQVFCKSYTNFAQEISKFCRSSNYKNFASEISIFLQRTLAFYTYLAVGMYNIVNNSIAVFLDSPGLMKFFVAAIPRGASGKENQTPTD